jgi:hypothetical protein
MTFIRKFTFPIKAVIFLVIASLAPLHAEGTKTLIWGDGKANRVNLVFLAEGFTQMQQAKFVNYVSKAMDSFFLFQPWSNFKMLCNVYAIGVVSADSGCDYPADGIVKDTYFGASYTGSKLTGKSGFLALNPMDADSHKTPFSRITTLLEEHVPDHDILCIIVNDNYIPGAWAYQYSAPPYVLMPTGYDPSPSVIRHEIAHIFAGVLDEYEFGTTLQGESKNTTAKTQRDQIRWNAWIAPSTPVPTPKTPEYFSVPGLFEGACGCTTGWYRPNYHCLMHDGFDTSKFCVICREEIIVNICKDISLIDTFSPPNSAAVKKIPGAFLSIRPVKPDSFRLATQWWVNGSLLLTVSDTLKLDNAGLKAGPNMVVVRAIDSSGMVRIPENRQFVMDSIAWNIDDGTAIAGAIPLPLLSEDKLRVVRRDNGVHVVYRLLRPQHVCITLWSAQGAQLHIAPAAMQCAGTHDALLGNRRIGSGVYIVQFSSDDCFETATIPVLSR